MGESKCGHVVIFPLPLQGPVNCMLKLAEILCHDGIQVTFLNSLHIQQRLLSCSNIQSLLHKYPNSRFEALPDGLPPDNPRTGDQILNLLQAMEAVTIPLFRQMLTSAPTPVTCLIADGVFASAVDVASQIGVPLFYFDTISPCGLWSLLCLPRLLQAGDFPFGDEKLDEIVRNAPGMEGIMRYRDLPSFFRIKEVEDPTIQLVMEEGKHIPLAEGLIFNTFEQLEGPILSQLRSICSKVYAIGPLHAHLKSRVGAATSNSSIWEEDKSCICWLDKQPSKSVIYVSVGSLAVMTKQQLYEIWHGLVNSGWRFLWVRRPGSEARIGSDPDHEILLDLLQATKQRGYIVSWAPQEEVLAHPAVAAFFTHSGWNSTLESIVCGKPMICWPFHADQQVNSRYVGEVWKLGVDMKDRCDRVVVEEMIREVMEVRKDELLKRAEAMAQLADSSVTQAGSSFTDLSRLIQDIKTNT